MRQSLFGTAVPARQVAAHPEFERLCELIRETRTLSEVLTEQEAAKAARKKFWYVEVKAVESMLPIPLTG